MGRDRRCTRLGQAARGVTSRPVRGRSPTLNTVVRTVSHHLPNLARRRTHVRTVNRRQSDRRSLLRYSTDKILVNLRPKGHFHQVSGQVVDFNRHGVAIVTSSAMPMDRFVFVTLQCGSIKAEKVVGVVHNSTRGDFGFRSGIRFRTQSQMQQDAERVETQLAAMELTVRSQPSSS